MVMPPNHFHQVSQPRVRGRRERWVVGLAGVVVALVLGVTIFSLTSHSPKNGHGCLSFTYSMAMGGEQFHACGAKAKQTCASPPKLGGLAGGFFRSLKEACADAKMPYRVS